MHTHPAGSKMEYFSPRKSHLPLILLRNFLQNFCISLHALFSFTNKYFKVIYRAP